MATPSRIGDIELNQDLQHEARSHKVGVIIKALWALLLLAALLGLLGPGVLSKNQLSDPTGQLAIEYHRFERVRSPVQLKVIASSLPKEAAPLRLSVSRDFFERIELRQVDPSPERVEIGEDILTYHFHRAKDSERFRVIFRYEPEQAGRLRGRVAFPGGPALEFQQLIYP